ncbi:MAG: 16S rRNA (guanine(527)-N(7))-methyltransferase RsmG [candidate division KSB1 bacterium]|nr:16S rRNA (guanine(527)-N(7))-methyltransferase RsmG [candidate division KSB1 bacterium]MDZ7369283.1 16S rRNA (guanine(527)-N(7))-methyltransferase RsmG [candidate division KSB1 bacterium]MDZ7407318.1 16S rRNA (guanine(527)-N(7))-methyltransferase RsmG [candidate division KSB1 bacterium]
MHEQLARLLKRFAQIRQTGRAPFWDLTSAQKKQLARYLRLLLEWNQRINLISPNDEDRIAERHILESLAVLSVWDFPKESTVLDLGSGAGFPGIPLKIIRPDLAMTLLESRQKKVLFLNTAVRELKMENCSVVNARAEEPSGEKYSIVIARAVADLKTLWEWSRPLLIWDGVLLAMKGGELNDELQALKKFDSRVEHRILYYPEGWEVEASRCLVVVANSQN